MMRFFLDANVLFSACISAEGRAAALVALARRGLCDLVTSAHAIEEAHRNLQARYPEAVAGLKAILRSVETVPEALPDRVDQVRRAYRLPLEDAPILASAIACKADALVTGDRTHFGSLFGSTIEGIKILSLREALKVVL